MKLFVEEDKKIYAPSCFESSLFWLLIIGFALIGVAVVGSTLLIWGLAQLRDSLN